MVFCIAIYLLSLRTVFMKKMRWLPKMREILRRRYAYIQLCFNAKFLLKSKSTTMDNLCVWFCVNQSLFNLCCFRRKNRGSSIHFFCITVLSFEFVIPTWTIQNGKMESIAAHLPKCLFKEIDFVRV